MIGCKLCKETVKKYDEKDLRDDEICLACDTKLIEVKREQESQKNVVRGFPESGQELTSLSS